MPRGSKIAPRTNFDKILGGFWDGFGKNLTEFWSGLGKTVVGSSDLEDPKSPSGPTGPRRMEAYLRLRPRYGYKYICVYRYAHVDIHIYT